MATLPACTPNRCEAFGERTKGWRGVCTCYGQDPSGAGNGAAAYLCVSLLAGGSLTGDGALALKELFNGEADVAGFIKDLGK